MQEKQSERYFNYTGTYIGGGFVTGGLPAESLEDAERQIRRENRRLLTLKVEEDPRGMN